MNIMLSSRLLFITVSISLFSLYQLAIAQGSTNKKQDEVWFLNLPNDTISVRRLYELSDSLAHESSELSRMAAETGLRIAKSIGFEEYNGKLYSCMGRYFYQQGEPSKALEYCHKNLDFYRKRNDSLHVAQAYSNIALIYMRSENQTEALKYLRNSEQIYLNAGRKTELPGIYNKIGGCYNEMGMFEEGGHYLLKAFDLAMFLQSHDQALYISNNLCNHFTSLNAFEDAKTYAFKTIQLADDLKNKSYQAIAYQSLGQVLFNQHQYKAAYDWYYKAYGINKAIGLRYESVQLMDNIAESLEFDGQLKEALMWFKRYKLANDSLINLDKAEAMAEQERKFQLKEKNEAIHALSLENKAKEADLARAETERNFLLLLGALIFSLVFIGWMHYQSKNRLNKILQSKNKQIALQNKQIEEQNDLLRRSNASLKEENIQAQFEILRNQINPHFLFNSLNTLASIIPQNPSSAVHFTHEFAKLFRKVLEFKNQHLISLEEELELVDRYLYLQRTRFADKLQVRQQIEAESLKEFVPPFCLQLLIENAIKHNEISSEKPLKISIFTENNQLCVLNNIQLRSSRPESTGIGLENIRRRYAILTGTTPIFERNGEQFEVRVPLLECEELHEINP